MHSSSVPDGPVLAGWQRVGRWRAEPEFIIGGRHGLRFYVPRRPRVRRDVVAEVWASERRPREIVRGDELTVGRIYFDDSVDPVAADEAAVRAGVAAAEAAAQSQQAEAAQFIIQNGHDVSSGHPATHGPAGAAGRS
jgi:hypothetical protein